MTSRKLFFFTFAVALGLLASTGVLAWTGPTASAPASNATAPLNVSGTGQIKQGGLELGAGFPNPTSLNGLIVHGNSMFSIPGRTAGAVGTLQITTGGASPISNRLLFGTDGSGWKFAISKNQGGTISDLLTVQDNGNVGVGTTNPGSQFVVNALGSNYGVASYAVNAPAVYGTSQASYGIYGHSGTSWGGVITQDGGNNGLVVERSDGAIYSELMAYGYGLSTNQAVLAPAFYYNSDERLKKNIVAIASSTALADVLALQPVTYNWRDPAQPTTTQLGFIAQQVEKVVPELVTTNASTTMKAVDYARVTPLLVGAIQAQQTQINAQRTQIDMQQKEIDDLKAEVETLKASK